MAPGLRISSPSAQVFVLGVIIGQETWKWGVGERVLERAGATWVSRPRCPGGSLDGRLWACSSEALLEGGYSHADICLFNKYLLNAYYVQLLDRAMNKTGIPALGELPVQLTDAHNIHTHARTETHNLQAHRGAQTHKLTPSHIQPHHLHLSGRHKPQVHRRA